MSERMRKIQEKLDAWAADLTAALPDDKLFLQHHRQEQALRAEVWAAEVEQNASSRAACIEANEASRRDSEARVRDVESSIRWRDENLAAFRLHLDEMRDLHREGFKQIADAIRSLRPSYPDGPG